MITIYHTLVNNSLEGRAQEYAPLPEAIARRIATYKSAHDRNLRTAGKLLLAQILKEHYPETKLSLASLQYDEPSGRPLFPGKKLQFSISHSGNLAICAVATQRIGIDAEEIRPVVMTDVEDYLTPQEQEFLKDQVDAASAFYELWTRKEAILKASGEGIGRPFSGIEVLAGPVLLDGHKWHWQPINVSPNYTVHLAAAMPAAEVQVQAVIL